MLIWEQWKPGFDDRMPIYRQISLLFCRAFVRGDLTPGQRIPSIREMSEYLKVNSNTVQRAFQEMERDGLISSKRGTGYFITEDIILKEKTRQNLAYVSIGRFIEEMRALGSSDREIMDELKSYLKGGQDNESGS